MSDDGAALLWRSETWKASAGGEPEPMLENVRVVEAGEWLMVPAASNVLAQWGADVIKIEHPVRGDPMRGSLRASRFESDFNFYAEQPNHSKRSLGIDLGHPRGREILLELIKDADVFVTSFRESARRRWGITYDDLVQVNPHIIYARSTGQGQRGDEADKPGFDGISYWARGGVSYMVTAPGDTARLMAAGGFGDMQGGFGIAAGVAAALYRRTVTGRGGLIDVSLLGSALWPMYEALEVANAGGKVPRTQIPPSAPRSEPRPILLYMRNPMSGIYPIGDEDSIALLMPHSDRYWPQFCDAISRPDLVDDPRYSSFAARDTHCEELALYIRNVFGKWSIDEVSRRLRDSGCPSSPCQRPEDVIRDPQVVANGYLMPHPSGPNEFVVANPVQYNNGVTRVRSAAPEVGQHTEEVLVALGHSWDEIVELKDSGTIT